MSVGRQEVTVSRKCIASFRLESESTDPSAEELKKYVNFISYDSTLCRKKYRINIEYLKTCQRDKRYIMFSKLVMYKGSILYIHVHPLIIINVINVYVNGLCFFCSFLIFSVVKRYVLGPVFFFVFSVIPPHGLASNIFLTSVTSATLCT